MSIRLFNNSGGYIDLNAGGDGTAANTFTLPAETGTIVTTGSTASVSQAMLASGVAGTGPAFKAYRGTSAFSFSSGSWTKIEFQTEEYDTASCYDPTTNYRFTPNVAGYYIVSIGVNLVGSSSPTVSGIGVYKNGDAFRYGPVNYFTVASTTTITGTSIVYLNGSTDYIEAYVYSNGTSPSVVNAQNQSVFEACLIRAA